MMRLWWHNMVVWVGIIHDSCKGHTSDTLGGELCEARHCDCHLCAIFQNSSINSECPWYEHYPILPASISHALTRTPNCLFTICMLLLLRDFLVEGLRFAWMCRNWYCINWSFCIFSSQKQEGWQETQVKHLGMFMSPLLSWVFAVLVLPWLSAYMVSWYFFGIKTQFSFA